MLLQTSKLDTPLKIIVTAILFYYAGKLAMPLVSPANFSGTIWPPVGIGLGAVLLWGNRVLPGVFLGDIGVKLAIYDISILEMTPNTLWVVGLMALNGVLRAWLGACLVRCYANYPNPLIELKEILRFFLLAGIAATFISSILNVLALYLLDLVQTEDILLAILNWWLGDSMGVIIFTPLFFLFFAGQELHWRRRRVSVGVPLVTLFFITVVAFQFIKNQEDQRLQTVFTAFGQQFQTAFEAQNSKYQEQLLFVKHFFESSEDITEHEFKQFTKALFSNKALQSMQWVTLVGNTDKFTLKYQVPVFSKELSAKSIEFNQALWAGFVANKAQQIYLSRASDDTQPTQVLIGLPVYKEQQLMGLVTANYALDTMIEQLGEYRALADMALQVKAVNQQGPFLFQSDKPHDLKGVLTLAYSFIAKQQLYFLLLPSENFIQQHYSAIVWWTSVAGMIITSLLTIVLLMLSGHTEVVKKEVNERTKALQVSNYKLVESESQFKELVQAQSAIVWRYDPIKQVFTFVSDEAEKLLGYPISRWLTEVDFWPNCIDERDRERAIKFCIDQTEQQKDHEFEYRMIAADGRIVWIKDIVNLKIEDGEVTELLGFMIDITEQKQSESIIHNMAFYDPLTSLPNRRLLMDRLERAIIIAQRHGHYGCVIFLDLDHFKLLNDSLGHHIGDDLLVQVAKRIQATIRGEDSAIRLGGDEFVVLVHANSNNLKEAAEHGLIVAEKIKKSLAVKFMLQDYQHHISSSIGITLFPEESQSINTILQQADTAMYRAKELGRNRISFFHPSMQIAADERLQLEKELRLAIESGQFVLCYQPQVNELGELISAEALVRWVHPEKGHISPADFIPVAEDTSLILPLGAWVLAEVCRQIKEWQQQGLIINNIAINVSSKQFRQNDFVQSVQNIMQESGVSPGLLEIELTERVVIDDIEDTVQKMQALKALGVSISIDDFGTGYSSLAYLKQLPVDILKVDQSFIRDITLDPSDAVIVETIIEMAHHLGLLTVAEGVETAEQFAFLSEQGCDMFQGFYFAKPLIAADFYKKFVG
ncbi:MAG: EAL domain-containing protein [Methyloprofundus sp.]|nr:EAL domain-containing protein [Methyloprofundus sp.]